MNSLEISRKEKDDFFKSDPDSPIPPDEREAFHGCSYFPENPDLRFEIVLLKLAVPEKILIYASKGESRDFLNIGRFQFSVEGQTAELFVYTQEGEDYFFVPFTDTTSGKDTYGGGRYLDLETLEDGRYLADFNLAYNPWCAYSHDFSCAIPPQENHISVPIRAGEKVYSNI